MANAILAQDREIPAASATPLGLVWPRFRREPGGLPALVALAIILLGVVFVPVVWPNPYETINPDYTLWAAPMGRVDPSNGHVFLLGGDSIGRDNFALLFQGGRLTLIVAVLPALIILVIGFILGAFSGYYGGRLDTILMRVTDFFLAIPLLPAYIISIRLVHASPHDTPVSDDAWSAILALTTVFVMFGWMGIGRLVRGHVLSLRSRAFVEAARALGASNSRIIFRHLLPNVTGPLIVAGVLAIGDFVIMEAMLAYFGLSFHDNNPPTTVSWGNMLASNQSNIWRLSNLNPFEDIRGYLPIFPCILILLTLLSLNFIADALREALDPRREL